MLFLTSAQPGNIYLLFIYLFIYYFLFSLVILLLYYYIIIIAMLFLTSAQYVVEFKKICIQHIVPRLIERYQYIDTILCV